MITKKRVLLSTLLMIVIGVIIFAVFINNKTIQADKLYPDNYQFVHALLIRDFSRLRRILQS